MSAANPSSGGSYIREPDGKLTLVQRTKRVNAKAEATAKPKRQSKKDRGNA